MTTTDLINGVKLRIRALDDEAGAVEGQEIAEPIAMLFHAILDELMFMQKDMLPARMLPRIIPRGAVESESESE